MPVACVDGVLSDRQLATWRAGPLDVSIQLTCAEVRAVLTGPCLARGIALASLTALQIVKLFPTSARQKHAWKLRRWAARIVGERARAVLASASWHQLRAAAQHDTETAQIRAAFACSPRKRTRRT